MWFRLCSGSVVPGLSWKRLLVKTSHCPGGSAVVATGHEPGTLLLTGLRKRHCNSNCNRWTRSKMNGSGFRMSHENKQFMQKQRPAEGECEAGPHARWGHCPGHRKDGESGSELGCISRILHTADRSSLRDQPAGQC